MRALVSLSGICKCILWFIECIQSHYSILIINNILYVLNSKWLQKQTNTMSESLNTLLICKINEKMIRIKCIQFRKNNKQMWEIITDIYYYYYYWKSQCIRLRLNQSPRNQTHHQSHRGPFHCCHRFDWCDVNFVHRYGPCNGRHQCHCLAFYHCNLFLN